MKIVLLQDVPKVGATGEVKDVADGFSRNYLIPRGLAAPATSPQVRRVQAILRAQAKLQAHSREEAQALAEGLQGQVFTIKTRAGPTGRLFGSVTTAQVAEAISKATGHQIDKHNVSVPGPMKQAGEYAVVVRLYPDISTSVTVSVQPQES